MSNTTGELLAMVSALHQRLEQAQHLAMDTDTVAALMEQLQGPHRLQTLRQRLSDSVQEQDKLRRSLGRLESALSEKKDEPELPAHLTARAVRLLRQCRDLLNRLRTFADDATLTGKENHPAAVLYQDTVLLTNLALRTIQTLPAGANRQMSLASAIDVLLAWIEQRSKAVELLLQQDRSEDEKLDELTRLLMRLRQGTLKNWNGFFTLAEVIAEEASEGKLFQLFAAEVNNPPRFVAAHCLNVARVVARVALQDSEWRARLLQPVVAALVHDVGMLAVPRGLLSGPQGLNPEQVGIIEKHAALGARWAERIQPAEPWLIEAIRSHHERMDGLGYPAGLTELEITPLARLLAVCDVYAALSSRRPYREALEPAHALAEVLQMVQRGELDGDFAKLLQRLSSYPPGTAVELKDRSCGVVVAVQAAPTQANPPEQVVLLLSDAQGKPLPFPQVIVVGENDRHFISRSLDGSERRKLFSNTYPQWA